MKSGLITWLASGENGLTRGDYCTHVHRDILIKGTTQIQKKPTVLA
jgi:hypothetical protein